MLSPSLAAASSESPEAGQLALANTAPVELPKMVVAEQSPSLLASPKFTEPLRDTPQTVVVIPQEVYSQEGATNLSDALRNTPGITFAAGEGGSAASTAGDAFYMRGFDTSNNVFIDGVRDVGAYGRDVFNLEQIEVAKGPAGSDIGRGASSGYVNLVTKVPHAENFGRSTLSFGFDDDTSGTRRRATADINQEVSGSPIPGTALRLNVMWQDSDSVGRQYAENKSWAIAPSLALGLGTPTRAFFALQHSKQDNRPDYGLPGAQFPGFSPAPPPVDWKIFYGFTRDYDRVTTNAYVARFEHEFSPRAKISNQTRFSTVSRDAVATAPGSSPTSYAPSTGLLTRSRQANRRDTDILSNQTNLLGQFKTGALDHHVSSGAEFSRETANSPAFTSAALTPIFITAPNPAAPADGAPVRSGAYTRAKIETAALYAFDTVKFAERWQVNLSLRGEHARTHYWNLATTGVPTTANATNNLLSWKTGLVYKIARNGSAYVAYGISFVPPGTDFTLSTALGNQNNPDTAPQRTESVEVGLKWDFFHGRLSTAAAVFDTSNDKTVYTDPILGPVPAGKQRVRGTELSISGHVNDDWLVFAGFAYLDSRIEQGTTTGNNPAGAALPLIPKISGNLWTTYRLPFRLTLGGGVQYVDAITRRDASSTAPRVASSYWLLNTMVSYEVNSWLTLRANVNNLADERYVQSYNNNGGRFNPGAPRSYLVTAELKF
jgi:catecholate siderophore receptor